MSMFANRSVRAGQVLGARLRAASSHYPAASTTASHVGESASCSDSSSSGSPPKHKRELAFAAISTFVGAAALYAALPAVVPSQPALFEEAKKTALNPNDWVHFKLQEIERVSHNTKKFRFSFDDPDVKSGLNVASCILTRAPTGSDGKDGKPAFITRPYTPTTSPDTVGYFDLVVKIYPEGKMTQHLARLNPGDTIEVKGPIPKLPYVANMKKSIGMIAGGTGITPMLQIIDAILSNPADLTQVSLIYANVSPEDILLKEKLDDMVATYPNFKVHYVVNNPTNDWKGGVGYLSLDTILKAMPAPATTSLVLVCGPPGMMNAVSGDKSSPRDQGELKGLLKQAGYTKDHVFKF